VTERLNPALLQMARYQTDKESNEKRAFQPPGGGGAPPMDPMAGGMPPGGAPPMDPAMAGGAPPMDPAMAGGAPPMAPPMDPAMGGMPPMPQDPMAAGAGGQKMKPEQMMQMLDFRLYNMQQQVTALLNHLNIQVPAGALVMPPGQMSPTPEAAMQGGPQDPAMAEGAPAGGGGGSAIGGIDPIQGASPELAAGGGGEAGGAPKMAGWNDYRIIHDPKKLPGHFMRKAEITEFMKEANEQAPPGYEVALVKASTGVKPDISSTDGDVDEQGPSVSPPDSSLTGFPQDGTQKSLRPQPNSTAGGSVDPLSDVTGDMPEAKSAAQAFSEHMAGDPVDRAVSYVGDAVPIDLPQSKTAALFNNNVSTNAQAIATMMRSKTRANA